MRKILNIALLGLLAFFTVLMVRITLPYLAFEDHVAFLRIKQWVIENQFWKGAFYTHVLTSCFCLLAGFTHFNRPLLSKVPQAHRSLGYLYIITILLFAAPSGLIMGWYANGGWTSQTAFILLSLLWWWFTFQAFRLARLGNFSAHRRMMVRSYALTLSAVTLRAWKFVIAATLRPHPMDMYMVVAWLGWVPNLLVVELYLAGVFQRVWKAWKRKGSSPNLELDP
ncbi:MAG TPA: hypothetical protein DCR93_18955 [Cytophagales bacterium]|nr:hypothetical protein [Cytophagales bacterium]